VQKANNEFGRQKSLRRGDIRHPLPSCPAGQQIGFVFAAKVR
jgi:hypothetical protein